MFYFDFIIFYSLGHKLTRTTSFAGRRRGFGYTVFEMQPHEERHRPKRRPADQEQGPAHRAGTRLRDQTGWEQRGPGRLLGHKWGALCRGSSPRVKRQCGSDAKRRSQRFRGAATGGEYGGEPGVRATAEGGVRGGGGGPGPIGPGRFEKGRCTSKEAGFRAKCYRKGPVTRKRSPNC